MFWAMDSKKENAFGIGDMCRWDHNTLEYEGLCTHSPLLEIVLGEFTLSPEELAANSAIMVNRRKERRRNNDLANKAKDPVKYQKLRNEASVRFRKNNPEKAKECGDRKRADNVAKQRYYCSVCNFAFKQNMSLKNHLKRQVHLNKVALLADGASQSSGL